MSKDSFKRANSIGSSAEQFVCDIFNGLGIDCQKEDDKSQRGSHDLVSDIGTIEVKYDWMAAKTGNLAVEIENTRKNEPSGLSSTQADWWVVVLGSGSTMVAWITSTNTLRDFVNEVAPHKVFDNAGDGNAKILLYKKDIILTIFTKVENHLNENLKSTQPAIED